MEARLLVKIGLRLFAIYLIGVGLWLLPTYLSYLYNNIPPNSQTGDASFYLQMILSPAPYGIVLWFLAPYLAKLVVGKEVADGPAPRDPMAWQIAGFTILGVYFAVSSLPALLGLLIETFWNGADSEHWMDGNYAALADHLIVVAGRLLLGVILILAADGITRFLRRFRNSGLAPVSKE